MLDGVLDTILGTIRDLDPVVRTVAAGIAILLETSILIGLVVPGDTIVLVAATGVVGPVQWLSMIAAVIVGALCGESIGFLIGRFFGPRIRDSRLGRRLGEHRWRIAERFVERRGGVAVFVSRFVPVLHSLVPLTVGMSSMSYRTFIAWTLPACALWSSVYVSVAATAALSYDEISRSLHIGGYVFVGIIIVFLVVVWAGKKLLQRLLHHELQDPGATAHDVPDDTGATADTAPARGTDLDARRTDETASAPLEIDSRQIGVDSRQDRDEQLAPGTDDLEADTAGESHGSEGTVTNARSSGRRRA